jgi:uncharacterized coiled-coil protein SlyX
MSPLTEKLAAILDEWDDLSKQLADITQQCSVKDGTILGLQQTIATQQQQLSRQASELSGLKSQLASLQAQVTAALLTAADPDDARIKKRIDAAYEAMANQKPLPIANALPGNNQTSASNSNSGSGSPIRPATPNSPSEPAPTASGERMAVSVGQLRLVPASPVGPRAASSNGAVKSNSNGQAKPQPQPIAVAMGGK